MIRHRRKPPSTGWLAGPDRGCNAHLQSLFVKTQHANGQICEGRNRGKEKSPEKCPGRYRHTHIHTRTMHLIEGSGLKCSHAFPFPTIPCIPFILAIFKQTIQCTVITLKRSVSGLPFEPARTCDRRSPGSASAGDKEKDHSKGLQKRQDPLKYTLPAGSCSRASESFQSLFSVANRAKGKKRGS